MLHLTALQQIRDPGLSPSTGRERLIRTRHTQLSSCIAGRAFLIKYCAKIKATIESEETLEHPDKEYVRYLWAVRELVDARLKEVARICELVEDAFYAAWFGGLAEACCFLDNETWMWNTAHVGFVMPPAHRPGGGAGPS